MKLNLDNHAIEKNFRRIQGIIELAGGWVDPELIVTSKDGGISLEKHDFPNPRKPLIALPTELLLDTEKAGVRIENDEFVCDPQPGALTKLQLELTECMFEIYNLTGKFADHKESCLWFSFSNAPDLLDRLLATRTLTPEQMTLREFTMESATRADYNEILLSTYLKARTIGHKQQARANDKQPVWEPPPTHKPEPRLMPLIDCTNHHHSAALFSFRNGFDVNSPNREFLLLGDSRPLPDSNECFACYHQLDLIDSYINYGFPDIHAPFVRSIPMTINLPGLGTIVVQATPTHPFTGTLPDGMAALRPYIPHTFVNQDYAYCISHIMIPTNTLAPRAMRRVLQLLLSELATKKGIAANNDIFDIVLNAEEQIIHNNVSYYKDLLALLDSKEQQPDKEYIAKALHTARFIAEMQLTKLYKYNPEK